QSVFKSDPHAGLLDENAEFLGNGFAAFLNNGFKRLLNTETGAQGIAHGDQGFGELQIELFEPSFLRMAMAKTGRERIRKNRSSPPMSPPSNPPGRVGSPNTRNPVRKPMMPALWDT